MKCVRHVLLGDCNTSWVLLQGTCSEAESLLITGEMHRAVPLLQQAAREFAFLCPNTKKRKAENSLKSGLVH